MTQEHYIKYKCFCCLFDLRKPSIFCPYSNTHNNNPVKEEVMNKQCSSCGGDCGRPGGYCGYGSPSGITWRKLNYENEGIRMETIPNAEIYIDEYEDRIFNKKKYRDELAVKFAVAMVGNPVFTGEYTPDDGHIIQLDVANFSYSFADAMIKKMEEDNA